MIIIAILSVIVYLYSNYCVVRELISTSKLNLLDVEHQKVHFSILLYLLVGLIFISQFIFIDTSFNSVIKYKLIDQDFWLFLLIISQITTSITRHFRKERKGESPILDYKQEVKRSIQFNFRKLTDFDILAKKFIDKKMKKGIKVFYLKTVENEVDKLKNLKKGETAEFGMGSYVEKLTNEVEHNYIYINRHPLVFGIHFHLNYSEVLEPLEKELDLYIFEGDKMKNIKVAKGEIYVVPKGVNHGVIFSEPNRIKLKWE